MAIRTKYRTSGKAKARYVRRHTCQDIYVWCEQDAENPRFDVAQGTCDAEDLPADIKQICDEAPITGFYACEWPLTGEVQK